MDLGAKGSRKPQNRPSCEKYLARDQMHDGRGRHRGPWTVGQIGSGLKAGFGWGPVLAMAQWKIL